MKSMLRSPLFHLLLYCAIQALGISIQSVPEANSVGVIEVQRERTVSLVCGLDDDFGTQADEELVWLRNGAVVKLTEENNKGRSSVCITPAIPEDDNAIFTCYVRKNTTVRASVTLSVTFGPQLSGSEKVTVEVEETLVLLCNIWANPPVSSVSWRLNGSTVDLIAGDFTVTSDGFTSQLKASRVEESLHEGTYQCTANTGHSKLFYVTVTEKTLKFPMMPMIAGLVVVGLTALLAIVSRWRTITKCCK